jgi:hypothetical protein
MDCTTCKCHSPTFDNESDLALHMWADSVTEIIEYEKPSMMFSAHSENGTSIAEIPDKRGMPTIRKNHSMLMSNHFKLSA